MKYLAILSLLLFSFTSTSSSDGIVGVWLSQIKDGKIEIYKSNGKFYGKIIWIKEPNDKNGSPLKDLKNPDSKKRASPLLGLNIVKDLEYSDGKWKNGTIYDPKEGKTYDCAIWLEDGKLKLRGYLGWFYDTKTWTRVK